MIKRIISLLSLISVIIAANVPAFFSRSFSEQKTFAAESTAAYARIFDENVLFYDDPGCTVAKFVLPVGYFVKVLAVDNYAVRVRYMDKNAAVPAREGFIKLEFFHAYTETPPKLLYPDFTPTLTADEVLFSDSAATTPKAVLPARTECAFYGSIDVLGEVFYCVYANGYVGYVRRSAFGAATLEPHPLPLYPPEIESSAAYSSEQSQKETAPYATSADSALTTVIVIAVTLVALSVVYLLFKPGKKTRYAFSEADRDDLL